MMIMKPTTTPGKESGSVIRLTTAFLPGKSFFSRKSPVKVPRSTLAAVTTTESTMVEIMLDAYRGFVMISA